MDYKIEWAEILMILGAAAGGVLAVILYAITNNNLSLSLFILGTTGGWILGFIINRLMYNKK